MFTEKTMWILDQKMGLHTNIIFPTMAASIFFSELTINISGWLGVQVSLNRLHFFLH